MPIRPTVKFTIVAGMVCDGAEAIVLFAVFRGVKMERKGFPKLLTSSRTQS
jgi:hypothetical protein